MEPIYRSTVLSTRAAERLAHNNTHALQLAKRSLELWPDNPDAAAIVVRACCRGPLSRCISPGTSAFRDLAFAPSGALITVGNVVAAWNPATGAQLWEVEPEGEAAVRVAVVREQIWIGMLFGRLCTVDAFSGEFQGAVHEFDATITHLEALPDETLLVCAEGRVHHLNAQGDILAQLAQFDPEDDFTSMTLDADGILYVSDASGTRSHGGKPNPQLSGVIPHKDGSLARLWRDGPMTVGRGVEGGRAAVDGALHNRPWPRDTEVRLTAAAWHPHHKSLVISDITGRVVQTDGTNADGELTAFVGAKAQKLVVSPSGQTTALYTGFKNPVYLVDLEDFVPSQPLIPHNHYNQRFVAVHRDTVAIACEHTIEVYQHRKLQYRLAGHQRAALKLHLQENTLYSAGDDGTVRCWDLATGTQKNLWVQPDTVVEPWAPTTSKGGVHTLARTPSSMSFARPSPGGTWLLTGAPDGSVQLWSLHRDRPVARFSIPRAEDGLWLDDNRFAVRGQGVWLGSVENPPHILDPPKPCRDFAYDGARYLAAVYAHKLVIWDVVSGLVSETFELSLPGKYVGWTRAGTLHAFGANREEHAFFHRERTRATSSELCRVPCLVSGAVSWVSWEPDTGCAWVAVDHCGVYRLPTTAANALLTAGKSFGSLQTPQNP